MMSVDAGLVPLLPMAMLSPFVTTWLVGAGVALTAIPILIHILNRQRFKVVNWAAMEFLLRAMRKNRKRLKLEQLILLAVRCLVVLLMASALAQPQFSCSQNSLGSIGGRAGMHVLVIDNSYSTAYATSHPGLPGVTGGKTHLEQEKLIAKRLIDNFAGSNESVAIITAARPATAIIGKPGYDLVAAKAAIDRIDQTSAGTDLAGALQLALKLADEEPKSTSKQLHILTDGTASAWQGAQGEAIKRVGPELVKQFRVAHYNMTEGKPQWNQSVSDLFPATNLVTTKFPTDLLVVPRGFGTAPDAALEFTIDGQPIGQPKVLKLGPNPKGDSEKIEIQPRDFKNGGPRVVRASLGGQDSSDPLKLDNSRLRVIDVAAELKVLIVEGTRGGSEAPLAGSGAFLQLALAPPADTVVGRDGPKSSSYVTADLISDIELRGKGLNDYRAIVLAGVGQITDAEADALKGFVETGGTLMVFMGEPVSKENYNAVMLPRNLMPGALIKLVDSPQDSAGYGFDFKPNSVLHPFLQLFANKENTGLDTAKVFTYWQSDVQPDAGVERVLNFLQPQGVAPGTSPDPAITHQALGLGHVVFVATTAGPKWTSFPAKMAYVQLMHEILLGGVRAGDYWMNLTVGQPLQIPPLVKLSGQPTLTDDAGTVLNVDPVTEKDPTTGADRGTVYRSRPLAKPGLYSLNLGNGTVPIAVNVPADEADVRTIGNDQVRKSLGDVELATFADELPGDQAGQSDRFDFAGIVLILLLGVLGVECLLALMFGHYRHSAVVRTA